MLDRDVVDGDPCREERLEIIGDTTTPSQAHNRMAVRYVQNSYIRLGRKPLLDVFGLKLSMDRNDIAVTHKFRKLLDRAKSQNLTVIHDGNPITKILRFFQVVGGVENRGAGRNDFSDHVQNVDTCLRVNTHRGFVEKNDGRPMDQADSHVEATFHTAGEPLHGLLGPISKADALQDLFSGTAKIASGKTVQSTPKVEILPCGEFFVQSDILWHHTEPPSDL